jgi:hypothetical protein
MISELPTSLSSCALQAMGFSDIFDPSRPILSGFTSASYPSNPTRKNPMKCSSSDHNARTNPRIQPLRRAAISHGFGRTLSWQRHEQRKDPVTGRISGHQHPPAADAVRDRPAVSCRNGCSSMADKLISEGHAEPIDGITDAQRTLEVRQ